VLAEAVGELSPAERRRRRLARAPVAIEVRSLSKTFKIPHQRVETIQEWLANPVGRREYRILRALNDISFDVRRGEFFGIVGRNGSGKSTLLKIMASIYRADSGRVRMAGRMAPFIELGVGFNPEMTARQNVVLNGVLMGLSRREAARRFDAVMDFAELQSFVDLKLKNYSSGMMVRLAFSVMVEADADIMLIDEVLAVGDAAFAQKCTSVFRERREAGRTIVLVTHDMASVQSFCDRAMLIHDAELQYLGDAEETAMRYYRLNFGGDADEVRTPGVLPDVSVRVIDTWLQNEAGERIANVEQGAPLSFHCVVEARRELVDPDFGFRFVDSDGAVIFGFNKRLRPAGAAGADGDPHGVQGPGGSVRIAAGTRIRIGGTIENRLLPGTYAVRCWIARNRTPGDIAVHGVHLLQFVVYGTEPGAGSFKIDDDVQAEIITGGPQGMR
jgi:ABC-2 type transport system ATP-binding protein